MLLNWLQRHDDRGGWTPTLAPGRRVYAVGDVHGRIDLLDSMLAALAEDSGSRKEARTDVVLLGDLIDRGPNARDALERARASLDWAQLHCLLGNHESIFLEILNGNLRLLPGWLRVGGGATLASWGIDPTVDITAPEKIWQDLRGAITPAEYQFLSALPTSLIFDDYLFVHAGIRPGLAIECQATDDLLWIREPFLSSRKRHSHFIVHGHTVTEAVEMRPNRAGLDIGAYRSGRLAALGLEEEHRWIIEIGNDASAEDTAP